MTTIQYIPLDLKFTLKDTRLILNIIYVWKLNQTVLKLDFRAVKFFVLPSTGFEPTPLIHCSTIRLALRPAPYIYIFFFLRNKTLLNLSSMMSAYIQSLNVFVTVSFTVVNIILKWNVVKHHHLNSMNMKWLSIANVSRAQTHRTSQCVPGWWITEYLLRGKLRTVFVSATEHGSSTSGG